MDVFPLQDQLIDAVIGFANAKIRQPDQVHDYFTGRWQPESLPKLPTCRRIQRDVRQWLLDRDPGFVLALEGFSSGPVEKVDKGIRLTGAIHSAFDFNSESREAHVYLTWQWSVSDASLRAICGLAVATIYQQKLRKRLGLCERAECDNIFIDTTSRGTPRQYCKTDECERARNRERVKDSRARQRKIKLKRRKT